MIEQGLVMLIQGTPAVVAISPAGGFLGTLPPNKPLPSWTFATVSNPTDYTLQGAVGLGMGRYQIDCYGATGADAIRLAKAIDDVLSGFLGVLTDPDATPVQGCFRSNMLDFFDEDARDFRRMLEYEIWYVTS